MQEKKRSPMDRRAQKSLRRRNEEIAYWRKRAGWYDDDVSMTQFNNGVYNSYYEADDDDTSYRGRTSSTYKVNNAEGLGRTLKIGAALVAIAVAICLLFRRKSSRKKVASSKHSPGKRSSGKQSAGNAMKHRSSSRSRSSRSRSRSKGPSSGDNYELMEDKSVSRKSRAGSVRSHSRGHSRSQSRSQSRGRHHSQGRKTGSGSRSRSRGRKNQAMESLV